MITLDNFESSVPYKILMRGMDYYDSDAVSELEETSPGEWEATVDGTESYNIEISMNGAEVESWNCDCPYDGEICKHVVATLFAIRDNQEKVRSSAFSERTAISPKNTLTPLDVSSDKSVEYVLSDNVELQQLLKFVQPKQLLDFICDYASKNQEFKTSLFEQVVVKNLKLSEPPADYRTKIQKAFNTTCQNSGSGRYSRYNDFVYDWVAIFNKVDSFLDKADLLLKSGNLDGVIAIALQLLRSIGESYDEDLLYEDDVDVSDYCDRAGDLIMEIAQYPKVSEKQMNDIVQELRQIAKLSTYRDYDIFDVDELMMQINILAQPAEKALTLIDNLLEERKDSYDLYKLVFRKVELLSELNELKKADDTIRQYLYLPEIRRHEIEKLISDGRYDGAIKLSDEGIEIAQKEQYIGTVNEWLRVKLSIYEKVGNVPEVINACRQLFISGRDRLEYYHKLKTLVPGKQWKVFLDTMMRETRFGESFSFGGNAQADIYVEEKEDERLFQLLSSVEYDQLGALMKYAHHLKSGYSEQLITMYVSHLKDYAEHNLGRSHYEYIDSALLCMQKLNGGKEAVKSLVGEFRIAYKRRPAMMEVLGRY